MFSILLTSLLCGRDVKAFAIFKSGQTSMMRLSAVGNGSKKGRTNPSIILVTDEDCNRQIILPGETRTICADDSFDKVGEKEINDDHGIVAVGVTGVVREEDDDLMEIASMCEIKKYEDTGRQLTLECIGRVKLHDFAQFLPYWKFHFSVFEEKQDNLEECRLVADNIETFIKKLSKSEFKFQEDSEDEDEDDTLFDRFNRAYARCYVIDHTTKNNPSDEIRSLTAISWATFIAVDEETTALNHFDYRLKALDYDTLFDRLKLGQYMLRERELRHQGLKMSIDPLSSGDDASTLDYSEEGFQ